MKFKCLIYFLFICGANVVFSNELEITWVRQTFVEAITNSQKAEKLYSILNSAENSTLPILIAYKGATEGLLAKNSLFPITKIKYLNKSLENIEKAIKLSPKNEEIRHIRFNLETSIPFFLGHSIHLTEDKSFLLQFLVNTHVNKGNSNLLKQYANTLLNSKLCKQSEINLLIKIIEQCKQA